MSGKGGHCYTFLVTTTLHMTPMTNIIRTADDESDVFGSSEFILTLMTSIKAKLTTTTPEPLGSRTVALTDLSFIS